MSIPFPSKQHLSRSSSLRSVYASSSNLEPTTNSIASPTFYERKAFPHLYSFSRGKANHSGPNGAPVIRTDHGSLVFPAERSGSTTWLKRYRKKNPNIFHILENSRNSVSNQSSIRSISSTRSTNDHHDRTRRRRKYKNKSPPFKHEFDPSLLSSALPEVTTLTDFRHNVLFKPQRAAHLRSQIKVQQEERKRKEDIEDAKLAAAPNMDELSDFELLKVTLREIRLHVEKLKVSGALDLRSFLGASLGTEEFARLFKTQIGVKLEGRKLDVVMNHFDKDKDGSIDYIEVHSQLMNPHRLHVSDAETSKEEMLQTALNKVRDKVMEKQRSKISKGTAKEEDLVNKTTGGKKGRGPDLKSIFSHFDTDNSGIVAREEFVESLIKLGVDMNRYELNQLYWTLDPDRSGKLSYAEFSRMFFDRRTRLNKEKNKRKKKLLKPHWTPTNSLEAREEISKDRKKMYCNINTPYKLEDQVAWQDDHVRRQKILHGLWKADRGGHHAKLLINNKAFLNSPAEEAIQLEKDYIKNKAKKLSNTFKERHDRIVRNKTKLLNAKSLLSPEITVPKFGRWNTDKSVPIIIDESILNGLEHNTGDENESGGEQEHYESDVDSMKGFRIAPEDWDMDDIAKIKAIA
jgi:Ca2+-binding EF-hand superfamily protein